MPNELIFNINIVNTNDLWKKVYLKYSILIIFQLTILSLLHSMTDL